MDSKPARIEIVRPRLFTAGAVAVVCAYGVLFALPFLFSLVAVSLLKFGVLTLLLPLLVVAATAYFLPFGFGNTHVTRLVQSLTPAIARAQDGFVVQLTLSPRLRSGLRAILDDADDIGYLSFNETGFLFEGDSVRLTVPYDQIRLVKSENIGLRGLFVYGCRIKVVAEGLGQVECLEFAERASRFLPASRSISKRLYQTLAQRVPQQTLPSAKV